MLPIFIKNPIALFYPPMDTYNMGIYIGSR